MTYHRYIYRFIYCYLFYCLLFGMTKWHVFIMSENDQYEHTTFHILRIKIYHFAANTQLTGKLQIFFLLLWTQISNFTKYQIKISLFWEANTMK